MRTIAIVNQKGGCGKTTVSINLAACLAREGRRTLLVDMDPQGHCALGLAVPEEQVEVGIYDVLAHRSNGSRIDLTRSIWQITANFDLSPATTALAEFEPLVRDDADREERLRAALADVDGKYDFVLIDCPPHIGLLTRNALAAAGEVIIPVDTGYFSLQGLTKQLETINKIKATRQTPLEVRVLANLYDVRTKLGREILNELKRKFGAQMCHTFINFNTKLREGASFGQPITEYDPGSMGYRDFLRLAREIIAACNGQESESTTILRQVEDLASRAEKLLATSRPLFKADGRENRDDVPASPEDVQRKIDDIYGPQPSESGVLFVVKQPGAQRVSLAGDFNNWSPESHQMMVNGAADTFKLFLPLERGAYRYRLVVDGDWRNDPHNPNVESNPFGELNSVVEVL